jgi:hypothetical protein
MKVLCVAEKPSISKAVATHLSGGRIETVRAQFLHRSKDTDKKSEAQYKKQVHQELRVRI